MFSRRKCIRWGFNAPPLRDVVIFEWNILNFSNPRQIHFNLKAFFFISALIRFHSSNWNFPQFFARFFRLSLKKVSSNLFFRHCNRISSCNDSIFARWSNWRAMLVHPFSLRVYPHDNNRRLCACFFRPNSLQRDSLSSLEKSWWIEKSNKWPERQWNCWQFAFLSRKYS